MTDFSTVLGQANLPRASLIGSARRPRSTRRYIQKRNTSQLHLIGTDTAPDVDKCFCIAQLAIGRMQWYVTCNDSNVSEQEAPMGADWNGGWSMDDGTGFLTELDLAQ